jgi:signal transduction histidine kinase/CheY-like chemotaxis protein
MQSMRVSTLPVPAMSVTAEGGDRATEPGSGGHDEKQQLHDFIVDRYVDLFLGQTRRAAWGTLAAASLMALTWSQATAPALPWAWLALVGAATVWRLTQAEGFIRRAGRIEAERRITGLLALNGLLLMAPLAGFGAMSEIQRSAVSLVLLALATGSVATTTGHRRTFLVYAGPLLVPLALAWVWTLHPQDVPWTTYGLAGLIVAFLGVLVSVGQQQHAVFRESCRIRFAEQELNRQLQQALTNESEAHRSKTHFLAAASHDLRQPIHSINVLLAALTMRPLDGRSADIVRLLTDVSAGLSAQLDTLLDISRLDAGSIKPEFQPTRLDQLLQAHHQAVQAVAAARGQTAVAEVAAPLTAMTDRNLLQRVLGNLTDNAMKYNRPGGRVTLGLRQDGDLALVSVTDTGIGIPRAEQSHVFREFYQIGNRERDRAKGLGLGLAIVERLCRLLGVSLQLESTEGVGTTVTLRIPVAPMAQEPNPAPGAVATQLPPGLRVLVVDDEVAIRESMGMLLQEWGCSVHLADGTTQAVQIALRAPVDVVLSDLRLAGEDTGLRVLQALRALHPQAKMALITGDTAPERIREAESAGAVLMHKPVSAHRLRDFLAAGHVGGA